MVVRTAVLLLSIAAATGCNTVEESIPQTSGASVRQLLATPYCDTNAVQRASWLLDARELSVHWSRLHGHRIEVPPQPAVDFAGETVALLEMGPRPTAGFALELASTQLTQENGAQVVTVNWREPAEGATMAQVLTSPCLMIALPKSMRGPIEVRDQTGTTRFSLSPRSVR